MPGMYSQARFFSSRLSVRMKPQLCMIVRTPVYNQITLAKFLNHIQNQTLMQMVLTTLTFQ